jgi:deoxycytidine triphosphate deaminase
MTGSAEDNRLRRDPRDEVWENWQGAVLLENEIEYYASLNPPLIEPLDRNNLKAAGYKLSLGSECRVGGKTLNLSEQSPKLVIEPHDLAVVSTYEKVNIPGFLIGRWNLRVSSSYEGVLWVGGPQVDPGYNGHLYCPLYNLSKRVVELEFKKPLFFIDFVRTTRFVQGKSTLWERKRDDSLDSYDIHRLKSAVHEDFEQFRSDISSGSKNLERLQQIVFPVLAIIISALAVIASLGIFGFYEIPSESKWVAISIGMSGLAFLLAVYALIRIKCYIKKK